MENDRLGGGPPPVRYKFSGFLPPDLGGQPPSPHPHPNIKRRYPTKQNKKKYSVHTAKKTKQKNLHWSLKKRFHFVNGRL